MGVLCDPGHPALAHFPTERHSDWQWWDLNINSTTLIVDSFNGGEPIVEMIDNFQNNRKLALLYEGSFADGRLMIATFDLMTDIDNRPVAKQMLVSVLEYMNGDGFNPKPLENFSDMDDVFGAANNQKQSAESIY